MTGKDLLKQALALIAETDTTDYEETGLVYINMLLAETHDQNNRMRRFSGLEPLEEYQQIETLEDELPCQEKLQREALPWGLIAKIYFDEDDSNARLSMWNEEYANRLNACDRWVADFGAVRKTTGDHFHTW